MDFLAHLAWSIIIFGKITPTNELIQILFFSVFPDLVWGIPAFFLFLLTKLRGGNTKILIHERQGWIKNVYYSSHSFVPLFIFFFVFSLILRSFYMTLLYDWGLHLLFDMFLHKGTLGNKPLYPVNYKIEGLLHWKNKKFLIANWVLICVLILFMFLKA